MRKWKNVCRRSNLNKRTPLLALLILSASLLFSCSKGASVATLELKIEELVCDDGQRIFEGQILSLEGIKAVTANIQNQKAIVKYRDNQVTEEQIIIHLSDFGFTVNDAPGNVVARGRLPACCFEKRKSNANKG